MKVELEPVILAPVNDVWRDEMAEMVARRSVGRYGAGQNELSVTGEAMVVAIRTGSTVTVYDCTIRRKGTCKL